MRSLAGKFMRLWREAWNKGDIAALDNWWGTFPRPKRHQTGEIALDEIRQASPVALLSPPRATPTTEKIDISDIATLPLNQRKRQAESDEADMLAETAQVRAIHRQTLPRDAFGLPYLAKQSDEKNEHLIPSGVAEFYRATGRYPSKIRLKLDRYIKTGKQQYYEVNGKRIPYEVGWEEHDIVLR